MNVSDLVNALPNVLLAVFTGIAIVVSIVSYTRTRGQQAYADLDSLYLEVLRIGVQYPKLRDPKYTIDYKNAFKEAEELYRYETYAYMVWNIVETIHDRKEKAIMVTWKPAIDSENRLHRAWFDNPENAYKFKESFKEYIRANYPNATKAT